jgi:voltage-gated potassium channel
MQRLRSQSCSPGEFIVRRGDEAHAMYLIAAGEVDVLLPRDSIRVGAGDFFGEASIIHRRRRSVTVKAVTACRLLVLDADDLHQLMDANPTMAAHIHDVMRERGEERAV